MKLAETSRYYKILSREMPEWLGEYINTEKMQAQKYISMVCGTLYSDLFGVKSFYSSLDHSVGVALIVWNFTHDRAQTLAVLGKSKV